MSEPWLDPGSWGKLISSVIWPGVAVTGIFLFRKPLTKLLGNVGEVDAFGVKVLRSVEAVTEEVKEGGDDPGATPPGSQGALAYSSWEAFEKVYPWLDLRKLQRRADRWAAEHDIPNSYDMGADNYRAFLAELGLPGGIKPPAARSATRSR